MPTTLYGGVDIAITFWWCLWGYYVNML